MTARDDAIVTLGQLVDAQTSPVLSTEDLERIIDAAQIKDTEGRTPSHPEWLPTYDLAYAAGDAYELKAIRIGTSAPGVRRFEAEGTKFERDRGPRYEDFMRAAQYWRTRATGTITSAIQVIEMLPTKRVISPRSAYDANAEVFADMNPDGLIVRWGLPTL